jgi:FkbM family methyltransferase
MQISPKSPTPAVDEKTFSTTDEIGYVLFGEGNFDQYDPHLLRYIQSIVARPSPNRRRQLANGNPTHRSQVGQSQFIDELLKGRRDGFFVECGAADGEGLSNSLFFELARNWTGLLVEANPQFYRTLLSRNRNAYVVGTCLSTVPKPARLRMRPTGVGGGIVGVFPDSRPENKVIVQNGDVEMTCLPLNSIMAALGRHHIDYMSLDVEGPELEILQTIDWKKIHIEVLTIEYAIWVGGSVGLDRLGSVRRLNNLRKFFNSTGIYKEVGLIPRNILEADAQDVVFQRI